jgi:hypothetical protein
VTDAALQIGHLLGFTGTRQGMTAIQKSHFLRIILEGNIEEFHHGDCIGADEQAHDIVRQYLPSCRIVIHPPSNLSKRAFLKGDVMLTPLPYMVRNRAIVDATWELIAAPFSSIEILRSGTWSTVLYARKVEKTIHMVYP